MKPILTKNWTLYWGIAPLPDGAEVLGLVSPKNRHTGVLIRLANGKYAQGNAGQIQTLSQPSIEKAIAAAEATVGSKPKPKSLPGKGRALPP